MQWSLSEVLKEELQIGRTYLQITYPTMGLYVENTDNARNSTFTVQPIQLENEQKKKNRENFSEVCIHMIT